MSLKFTILGCGSSPGVPRVGGDWGACDPKNPKNRRRRCSLLIEKSGIRGRTSILIDTSPDMREQLLDAGVTALDAVFFTHDHADHTHGIDDLRMIAYARRKRVDVYFDAQTRAILTRRFDYCFEPPPGSSYPAILTGHTISAGKSVRIGGAGGLIEALPFRQLHGGIDSLGFRMGGFAYSSDLSGLPPEALPLLQGLDVWVVDALRYQPHPSHLSVAQALTWIGQLQPKRAVLTHMHIDLDYDRLKRELPAGIEPAYDGMVIEV